VSNTLLRALRVSPETIASEPLSREELRLVVNEAGAMIPSRHQKMLVSILDLEKVTVDDIMVPRSDIVGIDLDEPIEEIRERLNNLQHTRIPLFRGDIDQVVGIVHVRRLMHLLRQGQLSQEGLEGAAREPYFVPASTPLHTQLQNFQRSQRRVGLVVDEYGEIQGLVTLEDILEEIVGEFTSDPAAQNQDIVAQPDGTYLVDGGASVRDLNRTLHWELPTAGPRTLNGLILEYLEAIPEPGTSLLLNGYPMEVVQTSANAVKTVRINARLRRLRARAAGEER
jgi:Mg2+/Co2+ transporter CorB